MLDETLEKEGRVFSKHNAGIVNLISQELGINAKSIIDFDLYFADSNPSCFVGLNNDFISSPRLDNLFSSFHGTNGVMQPSSQSLKSRTQASSSTLPPYLTTRKWVLNQLRVQDRQSSSSRCSGSISY